MFCDLFSDCVTNNDLWICNLVLMLATNSSDMKQRYFILLGSF